MNIDREAVLKALRQAPLEGAKIHELATLTQADAKGKHRLPPLLAQLIEEGAVERAPGMRYRLVGWTPPARVAPRSRNIPRAPTSRWRDASSACWEIRMIRRPRSKRSSSAATSPTSFPRR